MGSKNTCVVNFQDFIKVVQYILRVTPQQNIWEHLGQVIINFFKAEWVAFANKKQKVEIYYSSISHDKLHLESFQDIIENVMDSGFIALEKLKEPEPVNGAFLPIGNEGQFDIVMIIAHKSKIPKELIDVYLGIAGMAGTTNELRVHRLRLEELVKERTIELEKAKSRNELILHAVGDGIFGEDLEGRFTFVNPTAIKALGWSREQLIGEYLHDKINYSNCDGQHYPVEECNIYSAYKDGKVHHCDNDVFWRKDGSSFPIDYISTPIVENNRLVGAVVVFRDITQRKLIEEKLRVHAYTDTMTGVSNRRTGLITLEKELDEVYKGNQILSICFIDVDGLKVVNDVYGHAEGDFLIKSTASIIKSTVRGGDTVCRVGGDEFIIIFPNSSAIEAENVIKRIKETMEEHDKVNCKPYKLQFSYGIHDINKGEKLNVKEAIKIVDEKMYQNKALKKVARK